MPLLALIDAEDGREIAIRPERLFLAGYTGRDRDSVLRHIEELAAEGIPPPGRVPDVYPGVADAVQVGGELPAGRGWSSGEVEYVLLVTDYGTFVGVGSDHTDRELERTSVVTSKQAFPKIIGQRVWPLDSIASEWDDCMLRSWLTMAGERHLYQDGSLGSLIAPHDLPGLLSPSDLRAGTVIFSGTVPATMVAPKAGLIRFEGAIVRADGTPLMSCAYVYEAAPAHSAPEGRAAGRPE